MTNLPTMRAAFRTTVSGDSKYEMVFRFPSMEVMHTADDEWRAILSQPPEASEGVLRALEPKPDWSDDERSQLAYETGFHHAISAAISSLAQPAPEQGEA